MEEKLNDVLTKVKGIKFDAIENRKSLSSYRLLNSQINSAVLSLNTISHKFGLDHYVPAKSYTKLDSFITGELHPYGIVSYDHSFSAQKE